MLWRIRWDDDDSGSETEKYITINKIQCDTFEHSWGSTHTHANAHFTANLLAL